MFAVVAVLLVASAAAVQQSGMIHTSVLYQEMRTQITVWR